MNTKHEITFEVVSGNTLSASARREILELCSAAYEEDFEPHLKLLHNPVHLLLRRSGVLISHLAWVTRWLQIDDGKLLRTAYLEAVATAPEHQRKGFASGLLIRLIECIDDFELAALSPSDAGFYERLGWERWRGTLAVRAAPGLVPTPADEAMIYRLPLTGEIDLTGRLSAEWREGELW